MNKERRAPSPDRRLTVALAEIADTIVFLRPLIETIKLNDTVLETDSIALWAHFKLVYNADWVAKQTDAQLRFAVLNVTLQEFLGHQDRRTDREPGLWAAASAYVINAQIMDRIEKGHDPEGFLAPPGGIPLDPEFGTDKTIEEVYDVLASRLGSTIIQALDVSAIHDEAEDAGIPLDLDKLREALEEDAASSPDEPY